MAQAKQPEVLVIDKKAGTVTITLPLAAQPMKSKSHQNTTIASTGGNMNTAVTHDGQLVTIGVNVYRPPVKGDLDNPKHAQWLAKQK